MWVLVGKVFGRGLGAVGSDVTVEASGGPRGRMAGMVLLLQERAEGPLLGAMCSLGIRGSPGCVQCWMGAGMREKVNLGYGGLLQGI